jgi:hypothetical protein
MNERELAAHRYAEVGWPVFPCAPGAKVPLIKDGNGLHDATTQHRQIQAWWRATPTANVAIRTGAPGPDVLDVDVKPDSSGWPSFNKLVRAELVPPALAEIRTPSGGAHFYYRGTSQGNSSLRKSAVDYRGLNGYVVAPPSTVAGKPYELVHHGQSEATFDFAAARRLLEPEPERPARSVEHDDEELTRLAGWLKTQGEGHRNAGLFWAACRAVEGGHADLGALADAAREAGLKEREIDQTIESAQRTAGPFREAQKEAG